MEHMNVVVLLVILEMALIAKTQMNATMLHSVDVTVTHYVLILWVAILVHAKLDMKGMVEAARVSNNLDKKCFKLYAEEMGTRLHLFMKLQTAVKIGIAPEECLSYLPAHLLLDCRVP